jgi:hypothetical protein
MRSDAYLSMPAPTVDDVARIAAIANPVVRNLEITLCYARLASAFAARTGEGANWCTYATWASRQAGRIIRAEDLLDMLGRKLGEHRWLLHPIATTWRRLLRRGLFQNETRIGRLTAELHTPFDAFERASDAVARGNLKVFQEIAPEFARYLHECPADTPADAPQVQRFLNRLRAGDPPDGQRYLRQAFARYERCRYEPDPRMRAELAVLANLEVGLHEQTRLQPEIREALDAAHVTQDDLGQRALEALFPSTARWWAVVRYPADVVAGALASATQRASSRLAREVITESFMVLSLPGRVLALGSPLTDAYPEALRKPTSADLIKLLARFEPVRPAPDDSGVQDWSDFDQRMHFIVHLFCAFHLRGELFDPPFTAQQVETLGRGLVPDGEL